MEVSKGVGYCAGMAQSEDAGGGPLAGVRVIELAAIGPSAFAAMMLAELGADVVRVDRPGGTELTAGAEGVDLLNRGKRSIVLDLKSPVDVAVALRLIGRADVVIEGNRPGVAERLGVGPSECLELNPALVYGRMTGWGQSGPLAQAVGHDIDYIALTGALHAIGEAGGPPVPPLNLVGDFGGGANYLVIGILAALFEARGSGVGQVVDAAIVDGAAHLMASVHMLTAAGRWNEPRGTNLIDGGAPYFGTYRTSDDRYVAVGAMEPRFYAALVDGLGLSLDVSAQNDESSWPGTKALVAGAFATRTRDEWAAHFEGTDACVAPVLTTAEAARHPHIADRGSLVVRDGILQSAPAPRFSRTPTSLGSPPALPGAHGAEVLADWLGE